jgi:hypothetical protein
VSQFEPSGFVRARLLFCFIVEIGVTYGKQSQGSWNVPQRLQRRKMEEQSSGFFHLGGGGGGVF